MWKELPRRRKPTEGQKRTWGMGLKAGMRHLCKMQRSPTLRERTILLSEETEPEKTSVKYQNESKIKQKDIHWPMKCSAIFLAPRMSAVRLEYDIYHTDILRDRTLKFLLTLRLLGSAPQSEAYQLIRAVSEHRISKLFFSTSFLNANRQPRVSR